MAARPPLERERLGLLLHIFKVLRAGDSDRRCAEPLEHVRVGDVVTPAAAATSAAAQP
jgi:hypothetical protein